MLDHRARDQQRRLACELQPIAQVDVLRIAEEELVEAAEVEEQRPVDHHRRAARREHFALRGVSGVRGQVAAAIGDAVDRHDVAQAVEQARQSRDSAPAMSSEEFREHLEAAVRGGSVQAMKLWSDLHADDGKPADARALLGLKAKP